MTYTLTISSQGQIVIPVHVRQHLGVKPGSKLTLRTDQVGELPTATLEPPVSWVQRVKGIAQNVYGDVDQYLKAERESWEK